MEVHHHPDLHHKQKKFKEFFLEFIMIFLAVTLGFIAENVRESISDHGKEKEYVKSLINNLQDDTAIMRMVIKENTRKLDTLTLLQYLYAADFSKPENVSLLYRHCSMIGYYSIFKSNDATMMQLKTSGLQFIRRDHVADSIAAYDNSTKIIYASEDLYIKATDEALMATQQLIDYSVANDSTNNNTDGTLNNVTLPLYIDDKTSLPHFFNKVDFEVGGTVNYINNINRVLPYAERLITYLKKEYDLD